MVLHKNRRENQWIRTEDTEITEISPCINSQFFFDKGPQSTGLKKIASLTSIPGKTGYPHEEA
jgi:hypothetical protein